MKYASDKFAIQIVAMLSDYDGTSCPTRVLVKTSRQYYTNVRGVPLYQHISEKFLYLVRSKNYRNPGPFDEYCEWRQALRKWACHPGICDCSCWSEKYLSRLCQDGLRGISVSDLGLYYQTVWANRSINVGDEGGFAPATIKVH